MRHHRADCRGRDRLQRFVRGIGLACALSAGIADERPAFAQPRSFWAFESGQVRPLGLAPSGDWLFAVNTPDARLEVFRISRGAFVLWGSVPVGLEPVALAVRNESEVWVVNQLSDSVSVVDVSTKPGRVVRTLLVGDEPQDVVFAGAGRERAFVTTAHRGQHGPFPRARYQQPGSGRADVWVFDAAQAGAAATGTPLAILTLFGDSPRALAVSPDGSRVYAAVFRSGNQTAVVGEFAICDGGADAHPCTTPDAQAPGGALAPDTNAAGVGAPKTGLIVKYERATGAWRDESGRDWRDLVRFDLPDLDVFEIDALADPPAPLRAFANVGTALFNLAVNPATGSLYVSNSEARNEVRFEGRGDFSASAKPPGTAASVRGRLHESRISVIDALGVRPRHLNKHIPYGVSPVPPGVADASLATPMGIAVSSDGSTLYVAALGSNAVGVFDVDQLEADTFVPAAGNQIPLTGGGPTGLALDEPGKRLYVLTRFDNAVAVIDLETRAQVARWPLFQREPRSLIEGRPFLYDARLTSSNGEASCAACHVFGDVDELAWDLGNPDGEVEPNPNVGLDGNPPLPFHPMKGPMLTQTLRGISRHGPMHWRGDRTGGSVPASGDPLDEVAAFEAFNPAFGELLGRDEGPLASDDMRAFADFALQLVPPPNPLQRFDGSLRSDEAAGRALFFEKDSVFGATPQGAALFRCNDCHELDPARGLFGANGGGNNPNGQAFKAPHLRNLHRRIGSFGMPGLPPLTGESDGSHQGAQVRSAGFRHDGVFDTLFRFLSAPFFLLTDQQQRELEAFLLAFPSDLAPIVGQQVTLAPDAGDEIHARIDLLIARSAAPYPMPGAASATECDLVVKGTLGKLARGWLRSPDGSFRSDRAAEPALSDAELRALAQTPGQELTYTCFPPGSGVRAALDRDEDGHLDRDELDARSDTANPLSTPGAIPMPPCGQGFGMALLLPAFVLARAGVRAGRLARG